MSTATGSPNIYVATKGEPDELPTFILRTAYVPWERRNDMVMKLRDCRSHGQVLDCVANDTNAMILRDTGYPLEFADQGAQIVYTKCLLQGIARQRGAELFAKWRSGEHDSCFDDVESPPCDSGLELTHYQRAATAISRVVKDYELFMEQGTGKTAVVVSRINTDVKHFTEQRMYRALIVCPKNLRMNWENEIRTFSTHKGKVRTFRGSDVKRVRALVEAMTQESDERFTCVVTSYGLMVESWDTVLKHVPWDLVVLDEGHNIKYGPTTRAKVAMKVRDNGAARMLLTGTPIVNSVLDLHSQLEFIAPGTSDFRSRNAFNKYYAQATKINGWTKTTLDLAKIPEIQKRLPQVAFVVRKDEVMKDLPPKQYDILEVEMTERQSADYEAIATQLCLEIEDDIERGEREGRGREMVINNAFVKLMKLAQITSGFLILNKEVDEFGATLHDREIIKYADNPKMEILVEQIAEMEPLDKMLVWACWVPNIEMISSRLSREGIDHVTFYGGTKDADRDEAVRRINEDVDCRVFVGNPAAGGSGLNLLGYRPGATPLLETNVTREIYFSQSHKPVDRWQSEDRSHRKGTRKPVRITDLVVPQTIDEDIRVRVTQKKKHALDVQDLREIVKNIMERIKG